MAPPLTVIIPSYNRPAATERALASVCGETPAETEILLVDDGSNPPLTPNQPDARVRVLRHESNRGAAAARNTGLAAAQGEWVAFLDSDDEWLPGAFAQRWAEARADASATPLTVFVTGFEYASAERPERRYPRSSANPLWFASGCWFCPGSTALFRRAPVLEAIGPQDEVLRRLEDLDWFLRLALAGGDVRAAPVLAARIHRGARAAPSAIEAARTHLRAKHRALPTPLKSRLNAYLDLEHAAALSHDAPFQAAALLARSWLQAPRTRLHLEDFWSAHPNT